MANSPDFDADCLQLGDGIQWDGDITGNTVFRNTDEDVLADVHAQGISQRPASPFTDYSPYARRRHPQYLGPSFLADETLGSGRPGAVPSLTWGSSGETGTGSFTLAPHPLEYTSNVECINPQLLTRRNESPAYPTWCDEGPAQDILASLAKDNGNPPTEDHAVDSTAIREFTQERSCVRPATPWYPHRIHPPRVIAPAPVTRQSIQRSEGRDITRPSSSGNASISHDQRDVGSGVSGSREMSGGNGSGDPPTLESEAAPMPHQTGLRQRCWRCRIFKKSCTGGLPCNECLRVRNSRSFNLPCRTPRIVVLAKALLQEKFLAWFRTKQKSLVDADRKQRKEQENKAEGEADGGEEPEEFLVQLSAGIGPSFSLLVARVKPNLRPAYSPELPHVGGVERCTSAHITQRPAIYLRDGHEKMPILLNQWLDSVSSTYLRHSCERVFCGSHDWALKALGVVCDFCVAVCADAVSHTPGEEINSNAMLQKSARLFFAVYLTSTSLTVGGEGLKDEDERIEVAHQFRSVVQGVLVPLVSDISEHLDHLVWMKRKQYIGHIMATFVFVSLSGHFYQSICSRPLCGAANDPSIKAEIDDMNDSINELIYSTFRKTIKAITKDSKERQQQQLDTLSTWSQGLQLNRYNSRLICGLLDIARNVVERTADGDGLYPSLSLNGMTNDTFNPDASSAIFDAIAPLLHRDLQPLCRRNRHLHS
ncbi:hypothetical protein FQN49_001448 [Arthroderma sp. PD_2]|nr:hypothetical protein FQN49_001448 [Arthroderma sp. PD_2]